MKKGAWILIIGVFLISFVSASLDYDNPDIPAIQRVIEYIKHGGDNVFGTYNFNGGWQSGGLSIIGGILYAQEGRFHNITYLNVTRQELTITDNLIVGGNITVDTIFAKAINISNSSFSFTHDENDSISFSIQNANSGSNATSLIKTLNDAGGIFGIGIASSTYLLGSMLMPNMTALFSRSQGEMAFINSFKQAFVWYNNPSDDNDLNNLVEIMRVDESGLNLSGNFTGNQIYGEMYNFSSTSALKRVDLTTAGAYHNITNLTIGNLNGFSFVNDVSGSGGSKLVAQVSGLYRANFQISFEGVASGGLYGFSISHNANPDTHRNCYTRREGSGAVGSSSVTCLMDLTVGDFINVQVEDENDPVKDIDIHTLNLNLLRVGK